MWGNHPLGHFLLNSAYGLARGLGYDGRALPLFQLINSLLSGVTVAVFFVLELKLLGRPAHCTGGVAHPGGQRQLLELRRHS